MQTFAQDQRPTDNAPRSMQHAVPASVRSEEMEAPSFVHRVLRSPGEPLPNATRARFESSLGPWLGPVRLHRDREAAASAAALGANAYTVGHHIVLGRGSSDRVLVHELAHVAQQHGRPIPSTVPLERTDAPTEDTAKCGAERALAGAQISLTPAPHVHVARSPGSWFRFPFSGPSGMEMILESPATTANARERVAALVSAAETLDSTQAAAMHDRLVDPRTKIGTRFARLSTASRTKIVAILHARASAKEPPATSPPAPAPGSSPQAPTLTAHQKYEAELAFYTSTRQARLEEVKAELPRLSGQEIDVRWERDHTVFTGAASKPGHGLSPDQMIEIYRRNWNDRHNEGKARRIAIARNALEADAGRYAENILRFHDGDPAAMGPDFAQAFYDDKMGDLALQLVPDAYEVLLTAERSGKSLSLEELTHATVRATADLRQAAVEIKAWLEAEYGLSAMALGEEEALLLEDEALLLQRGSRNGRPATAVAGEIEAAESGSVNGRPATAAKGMIKLPNVRLPARPRVATKTQYWWGMKRGNFIKAQLENGRLTVTVKASGPYRRGGSKMLDDVFDHFGPDNIREFEGVWDPVDIKFGDNYNEFVENVNRYSGISEADAARNTWIGRQLEDRGFKSVEVPPHESGIVRPVFRK
ncbi:DUF4157 domain-containing protein [Dactylosporangium sp. McL0621]|uniref:eCIS core domain-containing protein n=1 Tax=Dactylosporangium sp. McL0621 TaxID=3415678 RepID=UPI003CEB3A71